MAALKGGHGGARKGAGRKPGPIQLLAADSDDPVEFLRQVMTEKGADGRLRLRAAVELAKIEGGGVKKPLTKKGAQTQAARAAGEGKFAPGAAPRMVIDNTK